MPRNASGNYELPTGNPVVSGTIIIAEWANQTLSDIAAEITSSLSREGEGGMLAPLKLTSGSALLPAMTFLNDPQSGLYLAGAGQVVMSIAGQPVMRWTASGVERWLDSGWTKIASNFFAGENPTLDNLDAALIIGGEVPGEHPHIAIGYNVIQAKLGATATNTLQLQRRGGDTQIWHNAGRRVTVTANDIVITGSASAHQPNRLAFQSNSGASSGSLGFTNAGRMDLRADAPGMALVVSLRSTAAGTTNNADAFSFVPDLGGPGKHGVETGIIRITGSGEANAASTTHGFEVAGTQRLKIGPDSIQTVNLAGTSASTSALRINAVSGGNVTIGHGATGVQINLSDSENYIHFTRLSVRLAEMVSPSLGSLLVRNTVTGSGLERVLTESDLEPEAVSSSRTLTPADRNRRLMCFSDAHINLPANMADHVGFSCFVYAMQTNVTYGGEVGVTVAPSGAGFPGFPYIPAGRMAWVKLSGAKLWAVVTM